MKKRILVIDDNEDILAVIKLALEMVGYEVSTSLNTAPLQNIACNRPDLILLDVLLVGENGSEICQQLKQGEQTRQIPVILLSAYAHLLEAAQQGSADDFLTKPFRLSDLRAIVSKHLPLSSMPPL